MEIEEIIGLIALFMFERNMIEITEKMSRRNDSIWAQISYFVFGFFDYVNGFFLYSRWKRNSQGFRDEVLSRLHALRDANSMNVDDLLQGSMLVLLVPFEKWIELQSSKYCKKYDDGRERFNSNFCYFLNTRVKSDFQFKCWLSCIHNWKSGTVGKNFWSGTYKCAGALCSIKYKAFIKVDPNLSRGDVPITFAWRGKIDHAVMVRPKRCCGSERVEIGRDILAFGTSQVQSRHIIKNHQEGFES